MTRIPEGIRMHVLASANVLLGASNFMVIALPDRYTVGQTINPSEVAGTHPARGAAWVLDGRCSHYLRDTETKMSLELLVVTRRGENAVPRWYSSAERSLVVAQHDARLMQDEIRVGFPRRRTLSRLRAAWSCERTKRALEVELLGPHDADLAPIADAFTLAECH